MSELLNFILDHEEAFKSRARLTSLYSDFALLKGTNPDGYAANTAAWRSALERACHAGLTPKPSGLSSAQETSASSTVLQAGDELVKQLESRELGRPLALGDVFEDAIAKGQILPLRPYLETKVPLVGKRRTSWIPSIRIPTPYDVVKWLLAQTGVFASSSSSLTSGQFVVLRNLEEASDAILNRVKAESSTSSSLVYSLQTLSAAYRDVLPDAAPLSPLDLTVLLTYLSRDKQAVALSRSPYTPSASKDTEQEPLVIKFSATNTPPLPAMQQDSTIASLKTLTLNLTSQIDALEQRIQQLDASLRASIPKSSTSAFEKSRALNLLRQKKGLETTLQRRIDSQTQVEQTITSIDDAVTNVEMTKAMEASAGVLEDLNKQVGGAEGVAQVMDRLADAHADSDEIGRVLQQDAEGQVDEADVEDELEQLVRESRPKEEDPEAKKRAEDAEREKQEEQDNATELAAVRGTAPAAEPDKAPELPSVSSTELGVEQEAAKNAQPDKIAEGPLRASLEDLSLKSTASVSGDHDAEPRSQDAKEPEAPKTQAEGEAS